MSKVPQYLIEEATRRGIVPGATIVQFVGSDKGQYATVLPVDQWQSTSDGDEVVVGKIPRGYNAYGYSSGRYATVLTPAPASEAEGLKEGDAVECSATMRAALVELANGLGVPVFETVGGDQERYPNLTWDGKDIDGTKSMPSNAHRKTFITPEAFIAKMRVTAALPKPIQIGDHKVDFLANGDIKVGCTRVDFTTLEAVYSEAKKHRP